MSYAKRTTPAGILRRRVAAVFACGLFGAVGVGRSAAAQVSESAAPIEVSASAPAAPVSKADCGVFLVEASPEGDGKIPAELKFMSEQLASPQFAAFKGFSLVKKQGLKLEKGKTKQAKLGPYKLELKLLGGDSSALKLYSLLRNDKGKTLVDTNYSLPHNGVLPTVVGRGKKAHIIAVRCRGK